MATRYAVKMSFNDSTSWTKLDKVFHPDYVFSAYRLKWNDGITIRYNDCLNAQGNQAFPSNGRCFYIGGGYPDAASEAYDAGTRAEALISVKGGIVDPPPTLTTIIDGWTVIKGSSFSEYRRSVSVNNVNWGTVRGGPNSSYGTEEGASATWAYCANVGTMVLPSDKSVLSSQYISAKTKNGSSFIGYWYNGECKSTNANWSNTTMSDMEGIVAVFGLPFGITFNANGGSGAMSSKSFYYGVEDYEPQGKIAANSFTRNGYTFVGWNTASDGSGVDISDEAQAESVYDDVGGSASITLYAKWVSIKLRKRGTGADATEDVDDVGTLVVTSSEDNFDQAITLTQIEEMVTIGGEEQTRKAWIFAPKPNVTYRVLCTLGSDAPDKLWTFSSPEDIVIGATPSNTTVTCSFTRKSVKQVTTGQQAVGGSINPEDMVATLAITTPSAPDEIAPGQTPPYTYGSYIAEQQIVATAQYPDGMMGWELVGALLQIGGASSTDISNYISGNNINIPASNFTDSMHIIGIFGRIDCEVSARVDAASALAVSGVSVEKYSAVDEGWILATKAKYGETVRIYATIDTGYELDGVYVNGVRTYTSIPPAGYIEHTVEGDTEFVVKAKVRVSLGVGHWNVEEEDWTNGECSITATVDGIAVASPQNGFDVILGQIVSYAVNMRDGWHFDAWFEGTEEEKPTSFDNPVPLPISDTAFTPTAPLAIIARVTDEILSYETKIGFFNYDNPDALVAIDADVENVTSFPEADEADTDDGNVVLTYSSGTKSVTLTFAENIGNLYFEKLQEYIGNSWVDAEVEGTAYSMLTNKSRVLRALYTTAGERTVTVAYANIPNVSPGTEERVCGEIGIVESNYPESSPDGKTIVANRGDPFTLRAVPKNGWSFVGWYYAPTHIGVPKYVGSEYKANIITTRTLYAYFEPDTHAVYEWEGRSTNKMMTWRSKVYVSPRPFNPSAIRVDATDSQGRGNNIALVTVGMMSSPDSTPSANAKTTLNNMQNYVVRRLPLRRPERYLQVEVQNDAEIDRIIVGTSMEGLAV